MNKILYRRVQETPKFVPLDYKTKYDKPCIPEEIDYDLEMTHYGTGIIPDKHPLKNHIRFHDCKNCESLNVKVIYASWCVSPNSGDAYWDYEIYCEDCQMYTQCSYSEND